MEKVTEMDGWLQRWGRLSRIVSLGSLLIVSLACSGSPEGPTRVSVEGEVTFHGQPLEEGAILFIPTGDTRGPSTGATIEAGKYYLPADRGPVIGELRVEIQAEKEIGYDITEPTETVQHIGEPLPAGQIPPEYNDRSILFVNTSANGENSFDFHLPIEK